MLFDDMLNYHIEKNADITIIRDMRDFYEELQHMGNLDVDETEK